MAREQSKRDIFAQRWKLKATGALAMKPSKIQIKSELIKNKYKNTGKFGLTSNFEPFFMRICTYRDERWKNSKITDYCRYL